MAEGRLRRGIVARETLLALLVLALAFLNFGHTNIVFASGGRLVLTTESWCGNPLIPVAGDHVPCHACRIGQAADLPPQPACVEPVVFAVTPVTHVDPTSAPGTAPLLRVANPRAPPFA